MNIAETSEIQYGATRIEYGIRRSDRRKTVSVAVDPVEGVLITAPPDVSVSRLDQVVHGKAQWIVERLRKAEDTDDILPPREFISGESYMYLGRHYRLKVLPRKEPDETRLERGWLVVQVARSLEEEDRSNFVRDQIVSWYRTHAEQRLRERVSKWFRQVGAEPATVLVKDQQKRWGSCDSKGNLRFNWRIIQAPMRLVDYVVVHELVHLVHKDHTSEYWAMLGRIMPDYENRREDLRRIGPRLEW